MTASPDAPPLKFETLDDAIRALRGTGLRLSTPRRLILQALFAAPGPVSASHLTRDLAIDESSVYRNLELLEQHGLVRHVHLGHSAGLYGLVTDARVEYLYCQRCGKVSAVIPERLDSIRKLIRLEFGYEAQFTHFAIVGICGDCVEQPSDSVGSDGGQPHGHRDRIDEHPPAAGLDH